MPIKKETPSSLKKIGATYTVIPSETIALVGDAVALGILVYLLNKPQDWDVYKPDIMRNLNIGSDRYQKAIKILEKCDLFLQVTIRNGDGTFRNKVTSVSASPMGLIHKAENPFADNPPVDKPNAGLSAPLHITDLKPITELKPITDTLERFDTFWNRYPRKTNKPAAQRAFAKHIKTDEMLDKVLHAIDQHLEQGAWCTGDDKQFIPHASTWLNRHGWDEEIIPRKKERKVNSQSAAQRSEEMIRRMNGQSAGGLLE